MCQLQEKQQQQQQTAKNINIWRLKNMLLNNQQTIEEIKIEIKICIETSENDTRQPKTYVIQ